MDESALARYRERVRRDNPLSRLVDQHRVIKDLLAQAADLDARVTRVARALGPDELRAFLDVLTMLRAAQFKAVSGRGDTDYQAWFAGLAGDIAAGKVPLERQPAIDQMASLVGLSIKCSAARQLDPACPPAAAAASAGPDASVLAAAQPLFDRYSAAQPRVAKARGVLGWAVAGGVPRADQGAGRRRPRPWRRPGRRRAGGAGRRTASALGPAHDPARP